MKLQKTATKNRDTNGVAVVIGMVEVADTGVRNSTHNVAVVIGMMEVAGTGVRNSTHIVAVDG